MRCPRYEEASGIRASGEPGEPKARRDAVGDAPPSHTTQRRQLWCYALSAKRYALFNQDEQGRPVLRKHSEHGLGHLLDPTDPPDTEDTAEDDEDRTAWMRTLWEGIVTEALGGQAYPWPDWLERPALGRITASSPAMLRPFKHVNQGKPYARQVIPCRTIVL
jgi:hypothetical protein